MDGIINLNKPLGVTSAKALYRVRKITGQRKSGHAGTLDPAATGVLVLCLGKATRLVERIMAQPKVYLAHARLDVTSATLDAEGRLAPVAVDRVPTLEQVCDALYGFLGTTLQVPPAVSAVKLGGVPAYRRVRKGEAVAIAPRPVRIDWIELVEYQWPQVTIRLCCGRGTYVRAIVRDLGAVLHVGGCLTGLARERVGPFELEAACSIEQLEGGADPAAFLMPLSEAERRVQTVTAIAAPASARVSTGCG
ncbi:MAG: tRNA pseudouridine(55) synthase TruB [Phycisphaerales bacterium]|nr:MAG: tRNA pseudouridine(55) synthase TruB [Phycisphaerales bacterium]